LTAKEVKRVGERVRFSRDRWASREHIVVQSLPVREVTLGGKTFKRRQRGRDGCYAYAGSQGLEKKKGERKEAPACGQGEQYITNILMPGKKRPGQEEHVILAYCSSHPLRKRRENKVKRDRVLADQKEADVGRSEAAQGTPISTVGLKGGEGTPEGRHVCGKERPVCDRMKKDPPLNYSFTKGTPRGSSLGGHGVQREVGLCPGEI